MKDLKLVYKADTEKLALEALDTLEETWGSKYPSLIASWRNNWPQLSTYFKYPTEIRKLIYTTNSIENFNRRLRKVTKSRTIHLGRYCRPINMQNNTLVTASAHKGIFYIFIVLVVLRKLFNNCSNLTDSMTYCGIYSIFSPILYYILLQYVLSVCISKNY